MNIVYKKVDEIIPYEKNPRHNEGAVEAVAKSIKEFRLPVPLRLLPKERRKEFAEAIGIKG